MENKDLIRKWLDNELDSREMVELQESRDYYLYKNIIENASRFEKPSFDEEKNLEDLKRRLSSPEKNVPKKADYSGMYKIAAILIVILSCGLFFWLNRPEVISTGNAEMLVLELPDRSSVKLNAASKIKYKPSKWNEQRRLFLEGEAFFKVQKGQKFTVQTDQGVISVLGTKFNVKERENYFEVTCYEGSVRVVTAKKEVVVTKGESVKVIDGDFKGVTVTDRSLPGWTFQESEFDAVPLIQVILELERQFDIDIKTENIDLDQLFTGSFSHTDKEIALKAITIPLQLKFKFITDKQVILYEE